MQDKDFLDPTPSVDNDVKVTPTPTESEFGGEKTSKIPTESEFGGKKTSKIPTEAVDTAPAEGGDKTEGSDKAPVWYVDLKREEFIAYRMLLARIQGPLRQRIPMCVISALCVLLCGGYALWDWSYRGWRGYPDPVLVVGALLVMIPAIIYCLYVPYHIKRQAGKQYDRSAQAGMDFCGELAVYPDCVEKIGQAVTAHVRLDERAVFVENQQMMVLFSMGSPAIVLPGRCLTEGMARTVRSAADRIPMHNRRFIARVQTRGETVPPPIPKENPRELWVATFTYTAEEYATVLKGILTQHFWRMAPMLACVAMMAAMAFGYDGQNILPAIGFFCVFLGLLVLFNLVLPLRRVKPQIEQMSAHDLTIQVRLDTMAMHLTLPKGATSWVLWCDVNHVYEREDCVEIVHNKHASLFIPKRCIPDLEAFDGVIKQCRGEQ